MQYPASCRFLNSSSTIISSTGYYVVFNTESLYLYSVDKAYRNAVDNAHGLLCDGIGVKLVYKLLNKVIYRYHGPDLFQDCLTRGDSLHIVIGGSDKAHESLNNKYEKYGNRFIFYGGIVDSDRVKKISEELLLLNEPFIVWVCLGIKKQEITCQELSKRGVEASLVGVGAAIDFLSGEKKRSGVFFQNLGLEWLPRLIREPRMLPRIYRSIKGMLMLLLAGVSDT